MNIMFIGSVVLLIFLAIVVVGVGIQIYNALLALNENVNKSWANIDVILKQRYDELPQLIKLCEQYVDYEAEMIEKIMSAREKMVQGRDVKEKSAAFNEVTAGIKGLLAVGEAYPELKANTNFLQIQTRLSALEEILADRREFYNDSVTIFNTRIQQIPDVLFAGRLGYRRKQMFEVNSDEKALPDLTIKRRRA
jgi:LemA protein